MTTTLCAIGHTRGHLDGCQDETCAGCRQVLAAEGLAVCGWHADKVTSALWGSTSLAALWADVEDTIGVKAAQIAPSGSGGASGGRVLIDQDALDWRTAVRVALTGWCQILAEEFDANLDGASDTVPWMVEKVSIYAQRLLASEHAEQLVSDLLGWVDEDGQRRGDLMGAGRRLYFRNRSQAGITVPCPGCGNRVRLEADKDAACSCGEWGTVSYFRDRIVPQMTEAMRLAELVPFLILNNRVSVKADTVRHWAARGHITTVGRDEFGASLYSPAEVAAVAERMRARRAGQRCVCTHNRISHHEGSGACPRDKVTKVLGEEIRTPCQCQEFEADDAIVQESATA